MGDERTVPANQGRELVFDEGFEKPMLVNARKDRVASLLEAEEQGFSNFVRLELLAAPVNFLDSIRIDEVEVFDAERADGLQNALQEFRSRKCEVKCQGEGRRRVRLDRDLEFTRSLVNSEASTGSEAPPDNPDSEKIIWFRAVNLENVTGASSA